MLRICVPKSMSMTVTLVILLKDLMLKNMLDLCHFRAPDNGKK